MGRSPKTVMLQLEDPIRMIERSGYTRRNGEPDGRELLHTLILKAALPAMQTAIAGMAYNLANRNANPFRERSTNHNISSCRFVLATRTSLPELSVSLHR